MELIVLSMLLGSLTMTVYHILQAGYVLHDKS